MAELSGKSFLGMCWRFPIDIDRTRNEPNRIGIAAYEQLIEESIRIILGTNRGERVMRPDFGSQLKRLVFAPNNTATAGLAIHYVQQALTKWEPRIKLLQVDANANPEEDTILLITVLYKIVATNNQRNLVYPFYLGGE
jgi:phage baseplate assembly protein W